jgi:hypothetical protein
MPDIRHETRAMMRPAAQPGDLSRFKNGLTPDLDISYVALRVRVRPRRGSSQSHSARSAGNASESYLRAGGPDWLHYRGEDSGGPFQVFDPGHDPVITWRIVAGIAAAS